MDIKKIITGKFKVNDQEFSIINAEAYPAEKVSAQYKAILAFKPGHLVAISYRGTLIPNLTHEEGVVRLKEVEVGGIVIKTPKAISEVLGIKSSMDPYLVEKA